MGRSVAASPAFARSTASAGDGVGQGGQGHRTRFSERSRPDPAELLHVGSDPQRIADVDGERPNVRSRVGDDIEEQLGPVLFQSVEAVDGADPAFASDRGADRRGLVDRPAELGNDALDLLGRRGAVQGHDRDVPLGELED
ncbi:MAG: hypothetical protein L3J96_03070, partial [Thermoplasmata archaeon]|nr:hypothetical protein [Thermoplasmata archaeon]